MKGYGHSSLCKGADEVGLWVEVRVGDCGFGGVQNLGVVSAGNPVNTAKENVISAVEARHVDSCKRSGFHPKHEHRYKNVVQNLKFLYNGCC